MDLEKLIRDGQVNDELLNIRYDGLRLSWGYREDIKISNKEPTLIKMSETSYLERDDQSYILSSRWPMHKLKVHLEIDAGLRDWEIIQATVGPRRYHSESGSLGTVEIDPTERRWVKVWVPDWVLPGLAVVVEWHSKAST